MARLTRLFMYGLVITWLPPVVDLLFRGQKAGGLAYIFAKATELPGLFFSYFGPLNSNGISLGNICGNKGADNSNCDSISGTVSGDWR